MGNRSRHNWAGSPQESVFSGWVIFSVKSGEFSLTLTLGIRMGKTVLEAFKEEPWLVSDWLGRRDAPEVRLRIVTDADERDKNAFLQRDVPLSFNQIHRQYGFRRVYEPNLYVPNPHSRSAAAESPAEHDPILELGED